MRHAILKPLKWLGAAPAIVVLAGIGGCREVTNPAAPAGGGQHLALQAGVTSDRAALMELFEATDGANWHDNTNWGTDADLEDWYGVWTWSGRVAHLVLRGNGLSGQIPAALEGLDALIRLDLSFNTNLTGGIPPELGNLGELRTLSLIANSLSGGIPPELGSLSSLTALDLRDNNLSGEIPPELGHLSSLEILYLINIGLEGGIPPELGALSALRWLHLGSNNLSGEIPSALGDLTGVEDLYLSNNALSGGVPASLGNLGALNRLALMRNRLTGALPQTFLSLRLADFSMQGNAGLCAPSTAEFRSWMEAMEFPDYRVNRSLCSPDREALAGLRDALDWDSEWRDDTDIRTWRGVTLDSDVRVTELRLGSSGLSGEIPTVLADLDRLKVLVLQNNGLVGEVPEVVTDLDLDVFWWSDNPGLCVPDTDAFRSWLEDMRSTSGQICGH
jgi:hypothetical protein